MKNTDFNLSNIPGFAPSDASFQALQHIIDDLGLEIEEIKAL